jgi:hypothetical protein
LQVADADAGVHWCLDYAPVGSELLVLDGDDGDGTAYVDEVATDAFTGAFSQDDPPVAAAGF